MAKLLNTRYAENHVFYKSILQIQICINTNMYFFSFLNSESNSVEHNSDSNYNSNYGNSN